MHIICLTPVEKGVYNDHKADHIKAPPAGWAMIPEGFPLPATFPRLGSVEAEKVDGVMTVTKMTEGEMPAPETHTPAQQREEAYNTQALIEWDGELLTVTQASQKWQYYAAEGNSKADLLQTLIATAKQIIREQYPDEVSADD
jgi:hypothetical protein